MGINAAVRRILDHCAGHDAQRVVIWGLVLALAIEGLSVFLRFGLGLESTRDTGFVGRVTFGVRVHHGYIGIVLGLTAWLFLPAGGLRSLTAIVAIGFFVSDAVHHFVVLWLVTGSPQFDLVYPRAGDQ